jgi:hypothetical protein
MRLSIFILLFLVLSGCSGMLLGGDVTPTQQEDNEEDEESRKDE